MIYLAKKTVQFYISGMAKVNTHCAATTATKCFWKLWISPAYQNQ